MPSANQLLDPKALVWTHVHSIQWTVKLIRSFSGRRMGRYGEMVTSLHLLDNGLRKSNGPYELILRYKEFLWEFLHHWYPKTFIGSWATCSPSLIGYRLCWDLIRGKCQSDLTTPAIDPFFIMAQTTLVRVLLVHCFLSFKVWIFQIEWFIFAFRNLLKKTDQNWPIIGERNSMID